MPGSYDWSAFDIYSYVDALQPRVFACWATPEGMESFFVRSAQVLGPDGMRRSAFETVSAGDRYRWQWWHDHESEGAFTVVEPHHRIAFTFGECEVSLSLKATALGTQVHLRQSGIAVSESARVNIHLDCRCGWLYFLCNLRAVLDHGCDIRQRRAETEGWPSVRFHGL